MPTPKEFKAKFLYHAYYHLVFKSVDGLLLFGNTSDYDLFLNRFKEFTKDFLDTWAYVLLRNHVHFIVKIRSVEEIEHYINNCSAEEQTEAVKKLAANNMKTDLLDGVIERQVNSFMVSYVRTINNRNNKQGGFFQKPFRRMLITDDSYLQQAIVYVHANAQKHNLVNDFLKYRYTSYHDIIRGNYLYIDTKAVLNFFNGTNKFIEIHRLQVEYYYNNNWPSSKIEV